MSNILYKSLARKLGFDIANDDEELTKFIKTVNECGIDINNETYRNFVAIETEDGTKQILCLKETKEHTMKCLSPYNVTMKFEEAETTLPLDDSIKAQVTAHQFAKIPEKDGVKVPDQKANQCIIFKGGREDSVNGGSNALLPNIVDAENYSLPKSVQLDWGGKPPTLSDLMFWVDGGIENGEFLNPSSKHLLSHKQLHVKIIELDKTVRIIKDGDNYINVPHVSMFPNIKDEKLLQPEAVSSSVKQAIGINFKPRFL